MIVVNAVRNHEPHVHGKHLLSSYSSKSDSILKCHPHPKINIIQRIPSTSILTNIPSVTRKVTRQFFCQPRKKTPPAAPNAGRFKMPRKKSGMRSMRMTSKPTGASSLSLDRTKMTITQSKERRERRRHALQTERESKSASSRSSLEPDSRIADDDGDGESLLPPLSELSLTSTSPAVDRRGFLHDDDDADEINIFDDDEPLSVTKTQPSEDAVVNRLTKQLRAVKEQHAAHYNPLFAQTGLMAPLSPLTSPSSSLQCRIRSTSNGDASHMSSPQRPPLLASHASSSPQRPPLLASRMSPQDAAATLVAKHTREMAEARGCLAAIVLDDGASTSKTMTAATSIATPRASDGSLLLCGVRMYPASAVDKCEISASPH
jgi:hypothetical protein